MIDSKKRALFVCPHLPSADAPQAGHKIAFANLAALSATHATDVLISCKSADLPPSAADEATLQRLARQLRFLPSSRPGRMLSIAKGMLHGLAPRLATRYSASCLKEFDSLLASGHYDTVWLEFSQCFWLAEHVNGRADEVVMSIHDVITQLVGTKAALEVLAGLGWTFSTERRLFASADRLRVLSTKDASFLATLFRCDPARIEVERPALSPFVFEVRRRAELIEPHSILFWGAMSRSENHDAVLQFASTTFTTLQRSFPDAKLYVVGSEPPSRLKALASGSIVVTGFVEDPTPYFERSAIGIAPLASGAGIKLKVLEMLEAGIPVISTALGAEGIGENALLSVASLEQFGAAIERAWNLH